MLQISERLVHVTAYSICTQLSTNRWAQAENIAFVGTYITTDKVYSSIFFFFFELLLFWERLTGQVSLVAGPMPIV